MQGSMCKRALPFAVFALVCAPTQADIYKWIDEHGQVVYSDRRRSESDERVEVKTSSSSAREAQARAAKELEQLRLLDESRRNRAATEQAAKQEKEKALADRQERCRRARDRYLMFAEANRLYRRDAKGERVYYTSAEIDAERVASQQAMNESCSGRN